MSAPRYRFNYDEWKDAGPAPADARLRSLLAEIAKLKRSDAPFVRSYKLSCAPCHVGHCDRIAGVLEALVALATAEPTDGGAP